MAAKGVNTQQHAGEQLSVPYAKSVNKLPLLDDNQTVEQATAGMTPEQRDAWLHNVDHQVEKDMEAAKEPYDRSKQHGIRFQNASDGVFGGNGSRTYDSGEVVIGNDAIDKKLTVGQLKTVIEHEKHHTQQPSERARNDKQWAEEDAIRSEGRVYGSKTPLEAAEKLERRDPLPPGAFYLQPGAKDGYVSLGRREELLKDSGSPAHKGAPKNEETKNNIVGGESPQVGEGLALYATVKATVQSVSASLREIMSGGADFAHGDTPPVALGQNGDIFAIRESMDKARELITAGGEATVARNNVYINDAADRGVAGRKV